LTWINTQAPAVTTLCKQFKVKTIKVSSSSHRVRLRFPISAFCSHDFCRLLDSDDGALIMDLEAITEVFGPYFTLRKLNVELVE